MTDTSWDRYIEGMRQFQSPLREEVIGMCRPRATPKGLARLAGLEVNMVYRFMRGDHTLTPANYDRLLAAVEALRTQEVNA